MKRILLLALVGIVVLTANAQDVKKLTLQECVKIALDNNLRVKRGAYNVENFEIALLQSKMAFLPSLNFGSSFGRNFGRALNPVDNNYVNKNSNTINLQGTSSWTVFNGLRITNTYRQSQRDYAASNMD